MLVDDIMNRTMSLEKKAIELAGEYDGWETFIVE